MKIRLKLYATISHCLPPHAHRNQAEVELPDDVTLNKVIEKYKIPPELAHLVLLNGVFICDVDRDQTGLMKDGDTLAIWPPVAGG